MATRKCTYISAAAYKQYVSGFGTVRVVPRLAGKSSSDGQLRYHNPNHYHQTETPTNTEKSSTMSKTKSTHTTTRKRIAVGGAVATTAALTLMTAGAAMPAMAAESTTPPVGTAADWAWTAPWMDRISTMPTDDSGRELFDESQYALKGGFSFTSNWIGADGLTAEEGTPGAFLNGGYAASSDGAACWLGSATGDLISPVSAEALDNGFITYESNPSHFNIISFPGTGEGTFLVDTPASDVRVSTPGFVPSIEIDLGACSELGVTEFYFPHADANTGIGRTGEGYRHAGTADVVLSPVTTVATNNAAQAEVAAPGATVAITGGVLRIDYDAGYDPAAGVQGVTFVDAIGLTSTGQQVVFKAGHQWGAERAPIIVSDPQPEVAKPVPFEADTGVENPADAAAVGIGAALLALLFMNAPGLARRVRARGTV